MAQRVIKIILPPDYKKQAFELLDKEDNTIFWQEESSAEYFVVNALTEAGHSESIMDVFERKYSYLEGFKLIVFPVEASIPRTDVIEKKNSLQTLKKVLRKKKLL